MADDSEVDKIFREHKVIPDVIPKTPKQFLTVTYKSDCRAEQGNELTPTQVKDPPDVQWQADDADLYTLILTDPDAPSRKEPKFREYLHWLVTNIPGHNIEKGELKTAYVGSGPPKGTGLHRYIFLLYKQSAKLRFDEPNIPRNSGKGRSNFTTSKFAKKYKLGDPIAANFFQAKWDDYVPVVHKQLSGK